MMRIIDKDWILALVCLLVGGVTGYVVGNEPTRIRGLEREIARLQMELAPSKEGSDAPSLHATAIIASHQPSLDEASSPSDENRRRHVAEVYEREVEARVARAAAERDGDYTLVFSNLGIGPEKSELLKSNLTELHRMAILAGDPLTELASSRSAYDREMRSLLSEEDYSRYRNYEASKPAVREYEMLRDYAINENNRVLDPAYEDEIVRLIRDAGATTTVTWHNPYDTLPRPAAGEAAIERMRTRYNALIEGSQLLLESAANSGLPAEYLHVLNNYYAMQVDKAHSTLAFWDRPIEEAVNDLKAQFEYSAEQTKSRAR